MAHLSGDKTENLKLKLQPADRSAPSPKPCDYIARRGCCGGRSGKREFCVSGKYDGRPELFPIRGMLPLRCTGKGQQGARLGAPSKNPLVN